VLRRCVWSRNIKNGCSIYIYDISRLRVKRACKIAKKVTISFVMSVCPSAWNSSPPTGQIVTNLDILLTVHLSIIYFFLFPTWYTVFFRLRTISAILFPLHFSGLTDPSSGGLNCTCSLWYSPPLQMSLTCGRWERTLSQRPHDKDICRGGEYHRLHVQFRLPDDGPVRPETCRGKRIADIVRRRKKQCIKLEIKKDCH